MVVASNKSRPWHKNGQNIKDIKIPRVDVELFDYQRGLLNTLIAYGYENGAMSINERDQLLAFYDAVSDYREV